RARREDGRAHADLRGLRRGDGQGGDLPRGRAPARRLDGDERARRRWPDPRDRRALRRHQGAARRLPPDRPARPRPPARVGGALRKREPRRRRGAPDLAEVVGHSPTSLDPATAVRAAAEAVARRSYGRLVALLAARTRDVAAAEDALSEAFAAALADWPT